MSIDPLELVEEEERAAERRLSRLNARVAATVAVLAAFLGIGQVKAGNVAQAMQQSQAKSVDHWAWYQFRKVRSEIFQGVADQMRLQALAVPAASRPTFKAQAAVYQKRADEQTQKMRETQALAEGFDRQYATLGATDDQFDLSEAFLSLSLALLALAALTQRSWLYLMALLPASLGVLLGGAGLLGRHLPTDALTKWLS
jgi:hypothetical protein